MIALTESRRLVIRRIWVRCVNKAEQAYARRQRHVEAYWDGLADAAGDLLDGES